MDTNHLIAKSHAGQRAAEFIADPDIQAAYFESIQGLEERILGFDPLDQGNTTVAKAMRLGILEFWAKIEGIIAAGQQAEAILAGELPENQPGRIL